MHKTAGLRFLNKPLLMMMLSFGLRLEDACAQAEDNPKEELLCRDLGDIFCMLEEFSRSLNFPISLSAKTTPEKLSAQGLMGRTVIDLQANRREVKINLNHPSQPSEVTLLNLNPKVNAWHLLKLQWGSDRVEWYHLDNVNSHQIGIDLSPTYPDGLILRKDQQPDQMCELWAKDKPNALRAARTVNAPYSSLCQKQLFLRNRIDGYRTTKEWVVEFLRANVWGGEAITNIVKETVYKDSYLLKSDAVSTKVDGGFELANAPKPARIAPKNRGEAVAVPELGIEVVGVKDNMLEVGRWYPTQRQAGVFVSVVEPRDLDEELMKSHRNLAKELDSIEMEAQAIMIGFDISAFDLHFSLGTDHPAVGWSERTLPEVRDPLTAGPDGFGRLDPLTSTGLIPPYISDRVVGIFTGGFKRDHGSFRWGELSKKNQGSHYGFMENGVVLSTIVPDLATLIVYNDQRVEIKTWTARDNQNLDQMRYVRQNGVPIIEWDEVSQQGIPGRWVSNWTLGNWSGSQDKKFRTLRAGVCQADNNGKRFLIYGYFSSMTPTGMARVFQGYGCSYAMHLDMNALEHTYMSLYALNKAQENTPQHLVNGMKVLDERFKGVVPRYIGYPDNRDFFYFVEKSRSNTR